MAETFGESTLSSAIAAALRDGYKAWYDEHGGGETSRDAWALNVRRLEVSCALAPGGPAMIVVEVNDRRPGRSTLTAYRFDRRAGSNVLRRAGH